MKELFTFALALTWLLTMRAGQMYVALASRGMI